MTIAVLDVDGTLVDSNYHHVLAWFRAFREHDLLVPVWRIHRHVGMGGDQFVAALAGDDFEATRGDAVRDSHGRHYMGVIEEIPPLPGARELIAELGRRGHTVVMASSGKAEEVERYRKLLDVEELVAGWTTAAEVDATKPAPDLVEAAIEKGGGGEAWLVGDSPFDCEAARKAGVGTIGLLSGGFSRAELVDAGAIMVFESAEELAASLDRTPLS